MDQCRENVRFHLLSVSLTSEKFATQRARFLAEETSRQETRDVTQVQYPFLSFNMTIQSTGCSNTFTVDTTIVLTFRHIAPSYRSLF